MEKIGKNLVVRCLLFLTIISKAQEGNVGINTTNPVITLEVAGVPKNTEKADGFLPPRLTGDELFAKNNAYNVEHKGTLVYITQSASEINQKGKTAKVDSEGYYFFDGNIWVKMISAENTSVQDYELKDVGTIFATQPVYAPYSPASWDNTRITPLGIETKIIVPVGEKYEVILDYSVPAGVRITPETYEISLANGETLEVVKRFSSYIGVSLLKNGDEVKGASRKFAMPMVSVPNEMPMLTIASGFSEILDNSEGTSDMEIKYSLNGYLEVNPNYTNSPAIMNITEENIVVYNMYSNNENYNFNWGKSSLRYQIYKVNK